MMKSLMLLRSRNRVRAQVVRDIFDVIEVAAKLYRVLS